MKRMLLLLLLVAVTPTAGAAGPDALPASRLRAERKTLTTRDGRSVAAESGTLMVPERRAVPGSRSIAIRFLRLKSTAAKPRAPLFYLAGGPGDRGVSDSPGAIGFWSAFLPVCDVVLIDQRGVGNPELSWTWEGMPPLDYFVHADSAARIDERFRPLALEAFRKRGVDLAGYTTFESATDLDELRAALGFEKVSLIAFSYGTHLACAYLKRFDRHVENAVLLGVEGPDQTFKLPWTMDVQFRKLALLAAADPRIGPRVPDLVALYDRVVAKLDREPMRVPVPAPSGNDTLMVPVGGFGLRFILRADIGDASDLPVFPRLLWSIDQGDPSVLAWFVRKRAGAALHVSAMNSSMDAASGVSPGRAALIASQARTSRFADVVNFGEPSSAWPVQPLGDDFRAPVVTNARVLLISGELDFNTPPFQSEEFRWGAPNATHLVVANAGHEQTFFANETAIPVVVDFLSGREVADRKITWPPLRFVPLEGLDPAVTHPSVTR